jgi:mRNA-degrading endonuclease YafQ of YafQ-DinJ toxin-antitoxin module
MRVLSTPRFDRDIKRLTKPQKEALNNSIRILTKTPLMGELKKGDLQGVRVYKFGSQSQQVLLAYAANTIENVIILLAYGTHENFYRDLKR